MSAHCETCGQAKWLSRIFPKVENELTAVKQEFEKQKELNQIQARLAGERIDVLNTLIGYDIVSLRDELLEIATELDGHAIHLRYPNECGVGTGKCDCGLSALREKLKKWRKP